MANITLLPTLEQVIYLSVDKAEKDLVGLLDRRYEEDNWNDEDFDIDNTVELVIEILRSMKRRKFSTANDFMYHWYKLMSPISLCMAKFHLKDSVYLVTLKSVLEHFAQAAELAEFIDLKSKPKAKPL